MSWQIGFIEQHIAGFRGSVLKEFSDRTPWDLTRNSIEIVEQLIGRLGDGYSTKSGVAVHVTATIEEGAVVKAPSIIGPRSQIASGAYIRGGCWLESDCTLGPGVELKSTFLFAGSRLAHFNFVGDSILGSEVNLEAGAIIANNRNELPTSTISFVYGGVRIDTNVKKFGALLGDRTIIGANAVIAPGAILASDSIIKRLSLIDHGTA